MTTTVKTKPDAPKITPKQKALIDELSETMHLTKGAVITRALELLKEVDYNRRMFFDAEQPKEAKR